MHFEGNLSLSVRQLDLGRRFGASLDFRGMGDARVRFERQAIASRRGDICHEHFLGNSYESMREAEKCIQGLESGLWNIFAEMFDVLLHVNRHAPVRRKISQNFRRK
jgi:hypothetical protein